MKSMQDFQSVKNTAYRKDKRIKEIGKFFQKEVDKVSLLYYYHNEVRDT